MKSEVIDLKTKLEGHAMSKMRETLSLPILLYVFM